MTDVVVDMVITMLKVWGGSTCRSIVLSIILVVKFGVTWLSLCYVTGLWACMTS